MVFSVVEIAPGSDFMRYGDNRVIYQIWEAISISKRAIPANYDINWKLIPTTEIIFDTLELN